jgi:CHAT domain-containing protein
MARSSLQRFGLLVVLASFISLTPPSRTKALGQTSTTTPSSLIPKQKERLKERDDLYAQIRQLRLQGKYDEAARLTEKMITLEKEIFGHDHDEVAVSLEILASIREEQRDFKAARRPRSDALQMVSKLHGGQHWKTKNAQVALANLDLLARLKSGEVDQIFLANRTHNLAADLRKQDHYEAAEKMESKALAIRLKILGEDHRDTAISFDSVGGDLREQGKYAAAEKMDRKALNIHLKIFGEQHPSTANSYNSVAMDLAYQGKSVAAEKDNQKALDIRRMIFGEEHPDTALSYNNLAANLARQGKYTAAEELDRKSVAIHIKVFGENHPNTAICYNSLAGDLGEQGKYRAAEEMNRKAMAIQVKVLGKEHPEAGNSYHNLGYHLALQGKYAAAEEMHRKALPIYLKVLGEENSKSAALLSNLAFDLAHQGKYSAAEEINRKVLGISLKVLGDEHPDTGTSFNNLAADLRRQGNYAAAEEFDRKALSIRVKVLGPEHPDSAMSYSNLAGDLAQQGKFLVAEGMNRKALAIFRKILGEEHPKTGSSYNNLAADLSHQGNYAAAEELDIRALGIRRKTLGEDHPETAIAYTNLAWTLYLQGDYARAEKYALAGAKSIQTARLQISFTGLERTEFAAKHSHVDFLAAVLAHNGKYTDAWKYLELDLGRGLFDDLSARNSRKLSEDELRTQETLQGKLTHLDKRIPELLAGKQKNSAEAAQLRKEHDRLLLALVQFQAELERKYGVVAGEVYNLERIQKNLAKGSALIAWLDMSGEPLAKDPSGEHWGVVVRAQGPPLWVRLQGSGPDGTWSAKDDLSQEVRNVLRNGRIDPSLDWKGLLADLFRQRLAPLQKHLEGVKHLIILPSSAMAGIPIETLDERYIISYAPSGTMYAWLQENRGNFAGQNLLALADPVFSAEQLKLVLARKDENLGRGQGLAPLPGTRGEVESLSRVFAARGARVQKFLGLAANFQNLERLAETKGLTQFRYFHLATHAAADDRGGMTSYLCLTSSEPEIMPYSKLTAGHILHRWQLNADLVTLSACQTGLGQLHGGEGYVGFAQALLMAGAHSLVLSQWNVSDWSTSLLMERFYQNLLGTRPELRRPMAKAEALREAKSWLRQLDREEVKNRLRDQGLMKRLQESGQNEPERYVDGRLTGPRPFAHPFYWSPFILIGDPGF